MKTEKYFDNVHKITCRPKSIELRTQKCRLHYSKETIEGSGVKTSRLIYIDKIYFGHETIHNQDFNGGLLTTNFFKDRNIQCKLDYYREVEETIHYPPRKIAFADSIWCWTTND